MTMTKICGIGCVFLLVVLDNSWACKRLLFSEKSKPTVETYVETEKGTQRGRETQAYSCGVCLEPIDVHFIVRNQYQTPYFEHSVSVRGHPQRELIFHLERAADMNPHFKFSTDYLGSLGYFLSTVNGLKGQDADKTYWKLIEHPTGKGLSLGLSMHVPNHDQTILFNFTTWAMPYDD